MSLLVQLVDELSRTPPWFIFLSEKHDVLCKNGSMFSQLVLNEVTVQVRGLNAGIFL